MPVELPTHGSADERWACTRAGGNAQWQWLANFAGRVMPDVRLTGASVKQSYLVAVLVIGLGVGAFALRIWLGNQELAEQERKIAEQKIALAKQLEDLAKLQADASKLASQPYTLKFLNVLNAYGEAGIKLGRPPNGPEEIKPYLKNADDLLSPRDGQPFEVSWGSPFLGARVWERTADETGGRYVSINAGIGRITARYVTEQEFKEIGGKAR